MFSNFKVTKFVKQSNEQKTQTMKTKIIIAKEIIEAMIFLGIPTEQFSAMKEQFGGLQGLYNHIESLIA